MTNVGVNGKMFYQTKYKKDSDDFISNLHSNLNFCSSLKLPILRKKH